MLFKVTAVGAPEGASVTYRILNEREEVFIHDGTGMISLTGKRFDREEEPIVRLLVQVGEEFLTASAAIVSIWVLEQTFYVVEKPARRRRLKQVSVSL